MKHLLSLLLGLIVIVSAAWILVQSAPRGTSPSGGTLFAEIYQDGRLIERIDLGAVETPYTFTVTGSGGRSNEIEVRPGSIGILSASCPDGLCVRQGWIHSPLLPVTCLPNRLVIRIREEATATAAPDAVTY